MRRSMATDSTLSVRFSRLVQSAPGSEMPEQPRVLLRTAKPEAVRSIDGVAESMAMDKWRLVRV